MIRSRGLFFLALACFFFHLRLIQGVEIRVSNTRLSANYCCGEFLNIKKHAEVEAFLPWLVFDESLVFVDADLYKFPSHCDWGGSIGAGFRTRSCLGLIGLNAFYDYRHPSKAQFRRIGLGAELLMSCLDIRINGYLPIGSRKKSVQLCVFDQLGDGFFAMKNTLEHVYDGLDGELGLPIVRQQGFSLYAALGLYCYYNKDLHNFCGVMGRVEISWRSLLSIQVRSSYDKVYSNKVQGLFQISLPFDIFCCDRDFCNYRQNPFTQPVRRSGIVFTDKSYDWKWNW